MNRRISRAMVEELLNSSSSAPQLDPEQRSSLALRALEYDPRNSDALLLLGEIQLGRGEYLRALNTVNMAIEAGQWRYISRIDALIHQSDILLRMKRYGDISAGYSDRWQEFINSPEILIRIARALFLHGDYEQANAICLRAAERYPEDIRFSLLPKEFTAPPFAGDAQFLISALRSASPRTAGVSPSGSLSEHLRTAVLAQLLQMEEGSSRDQLQLAFTRAGFSDPLLSLLEIQKSGYAGRDDLILNELEGDAFRDYFLLQSILDMNFSNSGRNREVFAELLTGISTLGVDTTRNGVDELSLHYREGALELLQLDWNQDGVYEMEVRFHRDISGIAVPRSVTLNEGSRSLQLLYDQYPGIFRARLSLYSASVPQETPGSPIPPAGHSKVSVPGVPGATAESMEQRDYYTSRMDVELPIVEYLNVEDNPRRVAGMGNRIPAFLRGELDWRSLPLALQAVTDNNPARDFILLSSLPDMDRIIDLLSPHIYLVESRYAESGQADMTEIRQTRFEAGEIIASRYNFDADADFELVHIFGKQGLKSSLRLDDLGSVYLAEYREDGSLSSQSLFSPEERYKIPEDLSLFLGMTGWNVPMNPLEDRE